MRPLTDPTIEPGRLEWGVQLPIQSQSRRFAARWEADASPADLLAIAGAADRAGAFYVAVCDHVAVPVEEAETMSTTWYDTVATLGAIAACTDRVRLLSHVFVPAYRHPLQVAKSFATLDALSGGRVIVGVGAGHVVGEFEALGVDHRRRGALLDESIDALDVALRDEIPTHVGEQWRFEGLGLRPRPVQRPRPPIWVGGSSPAAIRRAAERADGWLPQGPPAEGTRAGIERLLDLRRKAHGDTPVELGANAPWVYVGEPARDLGDRIVTGSAEEIAAPLRQLRDLGVSHLQIGFPTRSADEYAEQLAAFGEVVAPLLND